MQATTLALRVQADADLSITQILGFQGGCRTNYEIFVKNNGPDAAISPTVTAIVPRSLAYVGLSFPSTAPDSTNPYQITCSADMFQTTVFCRFQNALPSGSTARFVIDVSNPMTTFNPFWIMTAGVVSDTPDPAMASDTSPNSRWNSDNYYRIGNLTLNLSSDSINITDVVLLNGVIVGNVPTNVPPFTTLPNVADTDANGSINVEDVIVLQNYIVGNIYCLPQMGAVILAPSWLTGRARALPLTAYQEGGDTLVPITFDLTAVKGNGKGVGLGGYLARLEFDPGTLEVLGVVGGKDSGFPDVTASNTLDTGKVLIVGVHNKGTGVPGLVNVANVRVRAKSPQGLKSLRLTVERLASGFMDVGRGAKGIVGIEAEASK